MTPQAQERIKADAARIAESLPVKTDGDILVRVGYEDGYIAGATAENSRAHVLVDALGKISELDTPKSLDEYKTAFEYITKSISATAIEKWKGKEVGDE